MAAMHFVFRMRIARLMSKRVLFERKFRRNLGIIDLLSKLFEMNTFFVFHSTFINSEKDNERAKTLTYSECRVGAHILPKNKKT